MRLHGDYTYGSVRGLCLNNNSSCLTAHYGLMMLAVKQNLIQGSISDTAENGNILLNEKNPQNKTRTLAIIYDRTRSSTGDSNANISAALRFH